MIYDRMMLPDEVAQLFNVTTRTLRRWNVEGVLKGVRLGPRVVRYRRSDVEAAMSRGLMARR
jgi:excisionase family DNA binding protein